MIPGDWQGDERGQQHRRRLDQGNGTAGFEAKFVDGSRAAVAEVKLERLTQAHHLAGSGQEFGNVAAAQNSAWERSPESLFFNRKAEGFELRDDFEEAFGPAGAEECHGLEQRGVRIADEVSQDVQLTTFVFGG